MTRRFPIVLLAACLAYGTAGAPAAWATEAGTAGMLFLRLGVGARPAGMGDAFTAIADDATATYWNPAGMTAVRGTEVGLMHSEWIGDLRLEYAGLVHETDWGSFGLSFTGFYTGDIDRYEDAPLNSPLGTFSAHDANFELAYALQILPNLSLGAAGKYVYGKIDNETARGVAFDFGLLHQSRIKGVRFSAVLQNLGPTMKFVAEEFDLPLVGILGAAYHRRIPSLESDLNLSVDLLFPNDGDARQNVGAEAIYRGLFALRGGYKIGYDSQGATFGLGFLYKSLRLDYAALFVSNDLGNAHRFSLNLSL